MIRRLGLLCLALAGFGCAKGQSRDERPCDDRGAAVVDEALLAFLSRARSAHHAADAKESSGDPAAALLALKSVTVGAEPRGPAPEVDEVVADTWARIADLSSQSGQFQEAEAAVAAGLERAAAPSYFRGHLLEVRGLLEERQEKALRARGDGQEADRARQRSLAAYEEAMKIQARVIEDSLRAPPSAPSRSK